MFASALLGGPVLQPEKHTTPTESGITLSKVGLCIFRAIGYLSIVHDQNAVCVHHGVDAMCDGEHGAVVEGLFDGVLDQSVRL